MISDRDISVVSRGLVRMFGKEAPARAAMRATEYPENGNGEGRAFWQRIKKATKAALRSRRAQPGRPTSRNAQRGNATASLIISAGECHENHADVQ